VCFWIDKKAAFEGHVHETLSISFALITMFVYMQSVLLALTSAVVPFVGALTLKSAALPPSPSSSSSPTLSLGSLVCAAGADNTCVTYGTKHYRVYCDSVFGGIDITSEEGSYRDCVNRCTASNCEAFNYLQSSSDPGIGRCYVSANQGGIDFDLMRNEAGWTAVAEDSICSIGKPSPFQISFWSPSP
jgi:hypothetical protein